MMVDEREHVAWDHTIMVMSAWVGRKAWQCHPYKSKEDINERRNAAAVVPRNIQLAELLPPGKERNEVLEALEKIDKIYGSHESN